LRTYDDQSALTTAKEGHPRCKKRRVECKTNYWATSLNRYEFIAKPYHPTIVIPLSSSKNMPYGELLNRYHTQISTIYSKQFNILNVSLCFLCSTIASAQKLNAIT